MKHILIFAEIYLKTMLKNRRSAAILWLTPIFFLLGALFVGSQLLKGEAVVEPFKIAIVNEDKTMETELVIRQLTESPHLQGLMTTVEVDGEEAEVLFLDNQLAAIVQIPNGFSRDVARGLNTPVTVIGNGKRPLQAQLVRHVFESAADFTSAAQSGINTIDYFMDEAGFSRAERRDQFKRDVVSFGLHVLGRNELFEKMEQDQLFQLNVVHYYSLSFYVLLIMIWSFIALFLFNKHLSQAVQQRLLSLGGLKVQAVTARFFVSYLLVFFSSLVVIFLLSHFLGWESGSFIGVTLVLVLLFLSLFVLVESLIASEKVYLVVGIGVILVGSFVGEHFIPTVYYPDWLEQLNRMSVNGWALKWVFSFQQASDVYDASKLALLLIGVSVCCLLVSAFRLLGRKERW